jgi:hypothetical protein
MKTHPIVKKSIGNNDSSTEITGGLFELAKAVLDAKKEYAVVLEQESTKRMSISADLEKSLITINNKRQILEKHLEQEFHLRKDTISEILFRLDSAIDNNQESIAKSALSAIQGIVVENPLRRSDLNKFLDDGSGTLEI